ncbi:hypothetical protein [Brevibacillus parabrevis]|uniref:Uncharacterized protein n=1 Tax=Brevibacillus parabrevis TaxID=54914 RepID=A0A4Y3PT51_BREPA|nr:hypothetical protein [Brevibacillus parabrevis]RNB94964.1 hypothetical protein EDM60_13900 [Brevibacillus parabrevis]GEB34558.1 hypothetical protein BPA01_41380 [Brevibacillus parabrevis]
MQGKQFVFSLLTCTLCLSAVPVVSPALNIAAAASPAYKITYKLPANPEKYLFLNVQMVSLANPQTPATVREYPIKQYLVDSTGNLDHYKLEFDDNRKFVTSKKGFLWNFYQMIGIFPPAYPEGGKLAELDRQIDTLDGYSPEGLQARKARAELELNARIQPLIHAGYVKPEEIDDGIATREFVATVFYRAFKDVRPYHGGIDLKDSENEAVRWAVESGLPGFPVDSKGFVFPQSPLDLEPGEKNFPETYAYDRVFQFVQLIFPGKKTASGWAYYQVKLLPGMAPVQPREIISVNGKPFAEGAENYSIEQTNEYQNASRKIAQHFIQRFPQVLEQARKDALKPRVWDWSRDVIHHPTFAKQVAAYRKNKSSQNLNAVYQAVRAHYNLSIRQDSAANVKSVLDNVK